MDVDRCAMIPMVHVWRSLVITVAEARDKMRRYLSQSEQRQSTMDRVSWSRRRCSCPAEEAPAWEPVRLRMALTLLLVLACMAWDVFADGTAMAQPIAYQLGPEGQDQIRLISPRHTNNRRLTPSITLNGSPIEVAELSEPVFSRDGQLVVALGALSGTSENPTQIPMVFNRVTLQGVTFENWPVSAFDISLAFSPHGGRLIYFVEDTGEVGIISANSGSRTVLNASSETAGGIGIDWSSTDKQLVAVSYVGLTTCGLPRIFLAQLAPDFGSVASYTPLTNVNPSNPCLVQVTDTYPAFSKGGHRVAFVREVLDELAGSTIYGLEVINVDGSNEHVVARTSPNAGIGIAFPRWSADGLQLYFTLFNLFGDITDGVWVVNADGTGFVTSS
jgi:hypothetical protein